MMEVGLGMVAGGTLFGAGYLLAWWRAGTVLQRATRIRELAGTILQEADTRMVAVGVARAEAERVCQRAEQLTTAQEEALFTPRVVRRRERPDG